MTPKINRVLTQAALVAACVSVTGLAHSQSNRAAITKTVTGPVTLRLQSISADIDVLAGKARTIDISGTKLSSSKIALKQKGKVYRVMFDGMPMVRTGKLVVKLPAGSTLRVGNVSGNLTVKGLGGDVRLRSVSGDVKVSGAAKVDATCVSGDMKLRQISGDVRAKTVSGDLDIVSSGKGGTKLRVSTTSGDLNWTGRCAAGCNMRLNTLSGRLQLNLDKSSSFKVSYSSFSGGFKDGLGVTQKANGGRRMSATYGGGAGKIRARSFSGTLKLKKK